MLGQELDHVIFKCSRNIEKLQIRIKIEQVIQYSGADSAKKTAESVTSNFKIQKTFGWMEKIEKTQILSGPEGNFHNQETGDNSLQKDFFYTFTSEQENKIKVKLPFMKSNLGFHCENPLPSLMALRQGRPNSIQDKLNAVIASGMIERENDSRSMHIVLNINAMITGEQLEDIVLVSLSYNPSLEELKVFPRPNEGGSGYRLTPRGLTPPFYLYWIHLLQQHHVIHSEPHGSVGAMTPSLLFNRIEAATISVTLFLTVVKFTFYNMSNEKRFFINFSIDLPKGWSFLTDEEERYSSTNTSMDITNGVFQHLVSYSLISHLDLYSEAALFWPTLAMALMSENRNSETLMEAVCSIKVPPRPGRYSFDLPLNKFKEKNQPALSNLFDSKSSICHELVMNDSDVHDGLEGRYGFVSESVGTLAIELQAIHQVSK